MIIFVVVAMLTRLCEGCVIVHVFENEYVMPRDHRLAPGSSPDTALRLDALLRQERLSPVYEAARVACPALLAVPVSGKLAQGHPLKSQDSAWTKAGCIPRQRPSRKTLEQLLLL